MYGLTFELVVVATVIVLVNGDTVKYYATKYDHLDVERILNNRRMVNYYAQCLVNKGPCPPQGVEFKKILPEALETNCLRCTEKQKVVTYRTIKRLKKEYPKVWAELKSKWDPNDIYVKRFEETYKNPLPTTTPENEINLDDRFGVVDMTTKKATTKIVTKKPQKGKYPPAATPGVTTQRTKPFINNVNRPISFSPYNPNIGGNVSKNQVGESGSTQNDYSVSTASSITVNMMKTEVTSQSSVATVNSGPSKITPPFSVESVMNFTTVFIPKLPVVTSTSMSPSAVNLVHSSDKAEQATSSASPQIPLFPTLFTSKPLSFSTASEVNNEQELTVISSGSRKPLVNSAQAGITFDIPPSSISNSLTVTILQNSPITANIKPVTAIFPEAYSSVNTKRPATNLFQPNINAINRQPDIISQVLSSFLNNNRPPSISIEASVDKTISKNQGSRPATQVRLPSISVNAQAEVFNPVGNFVRDITNVGGRLIETGTSIADTLLSSVRTFFTPPRRTNRGARTRL